MAREVVLGYQVAWDIDENMGTLFVHTQTTKRGPIRFEDNTAFMAILMILQHEKPVFLDLDQRMLYTGDEPIESL